MTTQQRNARALVRMNPGGVIHTRTPDVNIDIQKDVIFNTFSVTKHYANGDVVRVKALSGAEVLDDLDRMNISIGG